MVTVSLLSTHVATSILLLWLWGLGESLHMLIQYCWSWLSPLRYVTFRLFYNPQNKETDEMPRGKEWRWRRINILDQANWIEKVFSSFQYRLYVVFAVVAVIFFLVLFTLQLRLYAQCSILSRCIERQLMHKFNTLHFIIIFPCITCFRETPTSWRNRSFYITIQTE